MPWRKGGLVMRTTLRRSRQNSALLEERERDGRIGYRNDDFAHAANVV